jgi:uncharacterized protein with PIN domain
MRELIQHIREDSTIFAPADPKEVERREADRKKMALKKRKDLEKKLGRKIDICPECNADLRKTGVKEYGTQNVSWDRYWNERAGIWEYGDSDYGDSTTDGTECPECGTELTSGEDFDIG